ncbi:MAG TPA: DUF488 domain-containing protein [Sphingomicrobium sp.]|nr:DUF488 domain-containing protein [Sphingomicrobium sp.]
MPCNGSFRTSEALPVFTIGHSTRTIPEFVKVLRTVEAELVVDVRTIPRSRTNPQYNFDVLGGELAPWSISYERIAELGGLRGKSRSVPPEVNGFWENQSFHNYADYALSEKFDHGLDELMAIAAERRTAIMCAEAVWWRCHRRIIADYLILRGRTVVHLMGEGREEPARMTSAARPDKGHLVYPASESQA